MHPLLFALPSYGLLLATALVVGWGIIRRLGRADRLPPGRLSSAYVLGAFAGLVVARVAWLLQQPGTSGAQYDLVALHGDQLAPIAGITAAGIVGGLYLTRRRIPVVAGYDVAAPALAAAAMIERLGALLSGAGFGAYAPTLGWAIRFPEGSPAFIEHQRSLSGLLSSGATESLPVHPTQVYGIVLAGIALAISLWLRRHRRYSGQVFLGTAIALLAGRSLVEEWFRADAQAATTGPFNNGQVGALVLIAALAVIMASRASLAKRKPDRFRLWEGGRWSPRASTPAADGRRGAAPKDTSTTSGRGKPSTAGRSGGSSRRARKGKGKGNKSRKKRR